MSFLKKCLNIITAMTLFLVSGSLFAITPTISISAPDVADTNTGPVVYTITYTSVGGGAITLVDGDVSLNTTGGATGTATVTGAGTTTRTVTISSITGDGTIGISLAAATANDGGGNDAAPAGPSATFNVDNVAPTVAISAPSLTDTAGTDVTYTITYTDADAVTLADGNVTVNTTGTATGTAVVSGAGTATRTVTVGSITGDGTLSISLASGTASDTATNAALAEGPSATFNVDNTGPTIAVSAPSATDTAGADVTYTITYTDAAAVILTDGDVTVNTTGTAAGTAVVSGGGTASRTVTVGSITGDGTLSISLAPGTAADALSNGALAEGPSATFNVDNTAPTVAISAPSAADANSGPITYTVTYTGADAVTLANGDVTVNTTGTAAGTAVVSGSGTTTRTVTISSITGDGTLGITLASNTAGDTAGNNAIAPAASGTFNVDNIAPTLAISAPSAADATSGPITYTVTYTGADAVTLANGDVSLNATGTATGTVAVTGAGTTARTVTISSITGDGTLGITLASGTATDAATNSALASSGSATFNVDNTAPTVAISVASAPVTAGTDVTYTVTYTDADAVTLADGDVTVNTTGTATGTATVTGSGTATRLVTISSIIGDGTLSVSLASGTATDAATNAALAEGPSGTFNVDNTGPAIVIGAPSAPATATSDVTYAINYSDSNGVISTLVDANVSLNTTGTAAGTVAVTGSGSSYVATVSGITGDGTISISLASGTATDSLSNASLAAGPSATFIVDNIAPTLSISAPSAPITASSDVTYTVTYSDANTLTSTLSVPNITLDTTGTAAGSLAVTGTGNTRTVTISSITGDGSLGITIAPATATDVAGNADVGVPPAATFVVDNTAPAIVVSGPDHPSVTSGDIEYTVTYSDTNAFTISLADPDVSAVAVLPAVAGPMVVSGSGSSTRTITLSGITGDGGSLGISLAPGTATDAAGNAAAPTAPSATFDVHPNHPGIVVVSGDVVIGETLTATVSDANLLTNAMFTYQWMSAGGNVGTDDPSYVIQASDDGNAVTVNVTYEDDDQNAEDITSIALPAVITEAQNALNLISDTASNPGTTVPTLSDYLDAGVVDVNTQILELLNIAVAAAANSAAVDEVSEIQALVVTINNGQDSDNDGLPNLVEGLNAANVDTDNDGTENYLDLDSDNDGISDMVESQLAQDDTDNDGIIDALDADVGNDGVVDAGNLDANFDGVDDNYDTLAKIFTAPAAPLTGTSPLTSPMVTGDLDQDNRPNHLDLDSDNDGVMDVVEAGLADANGDGLLDAGLAIITDAAALQNTDSLGNPNFINLQSVAGTDDRVSAGISDTLDDTPADGVIDGSIDNDNDGVLDAIDNALGGFGSYDDMDNDGIPNHADDDDDNDGILDSVENPQAASLTGQDADVDGIDDGIDFSVNGVTTGVDANANGVQDALELLDSDNDGIADHFDNDADNDGVPDISDTTVNTGIDVSSSSGIGSMGYGLLMALTALFITRRRRALLASLLLVAGASHAGDWQAGVGFGQSSFDPDLSTGTTVSDDKDSLVQFSIGYHINDDWMAELRHVDLGEISFASGATVEYTTISLNFQYTLPMLADNDQWSMYALIGGHSIDSDASAGAGLNLDKDESLDIQLGLGARYHMDADWSLGGEITSYNEATTAFSVSVNKGF